MRKQIILNSLKLNTNELAALDPNNLFKHYTNLKSFQEMTTFYLIQKNGNNKLFYLDDKNELKRITYKANKNDFIFTEPLVVDVVSNDTINQIVMANYQTYTDNKILDIRDRILYPILQLYFEIENPSFFGNKILWEKVDQKELELVKIYKNEKLSNEAKLELISNIINDNNEINGLENR